MKPHFVAGNVRADCPNCGAPTTFEWLASGTKFGGFVVAGAMYRGSSVHRLYYQVLRCAVCHRGALATVGSTGDYPDGTLLEFWPASRPHTPIPKAPDGIEKEFREAETCMGAEAWRGAAALLRSALEKTLLANGYDEKDLYKKIEAAGSDGTITSARRQRAQDLVRTLGNDVLHDEWREVTREEAEQAHHYVGRVIEDFYDDRSTVEKALTEKGRKFTPAP